MSKKFYVVMSCKKEDFKSYCHQGFKLSLIPGRACFVIYSLDCIINYCRTYNRFSNTDGSKSDYVVYYQSVSSLVL